MIFATTHTLVVGGFTVQVPSSASIQGKPQIGEFVQVTGRTLPDGQIVADQIQVDSEEFVGVVEAINAPTWIIGGQRVLVTSQTQVIGVARLGVQARVSVRTFANGTLLALKIDLQHQGAPAGDTDQGTPPRPTPTLHPTSTPRPAPSPTPSATPGEIEAPQPTASREHDGETPEPTDSHDGPGTPKPTEAPGGPNTPEPTDSHEDRQTLKPTESPGSSSTPEPRPTEIHDGHGTREPQPTDDHEGSNSGPSMPNPTDSHGDSSLVSQPTESPSH